MNEKEVISAAHSGSHLHLSEGKQREKNQFHLLVAVTKPETFPNVTSRNNLVGRTRFNYISFIRCSAPAPPEISSFGSSSYAKRFLRLDCESSTIEQGKRPIDLL